MALCVSFITVIHTTLVFITQQPSVAPQSDAPATRHAQLRAWRATVAISKTFSFSFPTFLFCSLAVCCPRCCHWTDSSICESDSTRLTGPILGGAGYPIQPVGNCNEGEAPRESVDAPESGAETAPEFYFEFNMGPANAQIPLSIYLEGWTAIAAILEKSFCSAAAELC